jgi:hypothetical protein
LELAGCPRGILELSHLRRDISQEQVEATASLSRLHGQNNHFGNIFLISQVARFSKKLLSNQAKFFFIKLNFLSLIPHIPQ